MRPCWRRAQAQCLLRASPDTLSRRSAPTLIRVPPLSTVKSSSTSAVSPIRISSLLRSQSSASSVGPNATTVSPLVSVNGFVRSVRKHKRVAFAAIGDGSSLQPLQVVMTPEHAKELSTGSSVTVVGRWHPSPSGKLQQFELHAEEVKVLGENDSEAYPLQKKYHTPDFLRTIPHLRARLPYNSLLLRLRSQVIASATSFFARKDFVQTHPPIITSSDCEGAGEVFSVTMSPKSSVHSESSIKLVTKQAENFFNSPKYLTVSSQLHLEALAQSVGSVWTLSPTFRAEKSDTPRHLSEFYMLEAEISFIEKLDFLMDVVEDFLKDTTSQLLSSDIGKELLSARPKETEITGDDPDISREALSQRWQNLAAGLWPRIPFVDAISWLEKCRLEGKANFEFEPSFEEGIQAEHEKYLASSIGKNGPIFVTDYPRHLKPFYMAPSSTGSSHTDTRSTVACFDLLIPDTCELVGGSMREHRLENLMGAMQLHGLLNKPKQSEEPVISERADGETASPHAAASHTDLECYESLPPNFSLTANMMAGAFAGIAEHSVMYPIDLLKTRMQIVNPSPTAVYSGLSNAMVTISRAEGFRTLWRGLSSVVLGAGPAHAVYFATYETVKHAMGGNQGGSDEHHPLAAASSGAAATIASDALMNPFDVIKQRMQVHGSSYRSIFHCMSSVFRREGFTAFYVSYPTTLCMTVPFTALQFMAYESLSKTFNPSGRYDPYTHCAAGGLAGGFAAGLTTPLDVVKTLLQTRGTATDAEIRNARGLWNAAGIIKRRDGYKGFFRGLKPRIITTMPSTAICWSAYEMAKAFFIARNERYAS
ncbi:mitochondrial carrier domain-containing protein [Lineolata rhizophorae]|uniref:asparagine--tRNA ligase n=1 Tax=Lineolata rhizophorae TaxID=578093 RepID=A0A6A6P6D0_9PEZI|nr:mitochondrial carrier domain-containing protein [Lineolata rhizophorae]